MIINNFHLSDKNYLKEFRKLLAHSFQKRNQKSVDNIINIPLKNLFLAQQLRKPRYKINEI
jgi:hypothetical protein